MSGFSSTVARNASAGILVLVPVLLLVSAVIVYRAFGGFDTDPDYAYLLNSLSILQIRQPDMYLHPGTTVEILGGIVIGVVGLVRRVLGEAPSIQTDVLLNPEFYLVAIDGTIVAMQAVALFFLGQQIVRASGSLLVAFVAQASVFVSTVTIHSALVKMAPESFLLFTSILIAIFAAPFVFAQNPIIDRRRSFWLGVAIGLSLATKINALPLLFAIFYVDGARGRLAALGATGAAAIFFTLPISHQYFHIYRTYVGFATHTGIYGAGAEGYPALATLIDNLRGMVTENPEIFLDVVACGVGFVVVIAQRNWRAARFFVVSGLILGAEIALVVKTPLQHYLMPVLGTCCLVNAVVAYRALGGTRVRRALVTAGIAGLLLLGGAREFVDARELVASATATHRENQALLAMVAGSGCIAIYYHDAPTPVYQLEFGDAWTDNRFGRSLAALYPDALFYDFSGKDLEAFGANIGRAAEQQRLAGARCVYLVGSGLERFNDAELPRESLSLVAKRHDADIAALAVYELHRGADGQWPPLSRLP